MTMLALAFSPDFCVVAADRAVGNLNAAGLSTTATKNTKIKHFNEEPMPFIATAAGFAEAVELVPDIVKYNSIKSPSDLIGLAEVLAKSMKKALEEDLWSQTHTTSCTLALTADNQFFVHSLYLNDEEVLFSGFEPKKSVIPAGFCAPEHRAQKEHWQEMLTEAIMSNEQKLTPQERLNRVLEVMSNAFEECASLNQFVSKDFDYCVITKHDRKISLNQTPTNSIFE
ncbi:hypothetical protein VFES401_14930 [Aliivibrio fischeri]|uniref:hypothetical protein n=1 Tax=Aliivibrio fischeri TaxID=668 RepID=UPI00107E9A47|nr:hypothetical protein [Aliivibrio fischeri]TGA68187.1 hypothetical protein VFES401_14930 [Aliivibrio fischeri]